MAIVPVPTLPGRSADRRIVPDLLWIKHNFKVTFGDIYADSGHAAGGEHPRGLGADITPDVARGGSWDDVDRLAAFAAKHRDIFPFIGYDGRFGTDAYPNHGRGNHLHLSWWGNPSRAGARPTKTLTGSAATKDGQGGPTALSRALGAIPGAGPALEGAEAASGVVGDALGVGKDLAGDAAQATAKAIVGVLIDALGADAAKIALYPAFLFAGAGLVAVGLARMLGVKPADVVGVATTVATRGAVKPPGPAGAAAATLKEAA